MCGGGRIKIFHVNVKKIGRNIIRVNIVKFTGFRFPLAFPTDFSLIVETGNSLKMWAQVSFIFGAGPFLFPISKLVFLLCEKNKFDIRFFITS